MKFRPLHDRVALTSIDAEEKSTGGIIIPDTAKEKPQQGKSPLSDLLGATTAASRFRSTSKPVTGCRSAKWSGTGVKIDGVEPHHEKSDIMGGWPKRKLRRRLPDATDFSGGAGDPASLNETIHQLYRFLATRL